MVGEDAVESTSISSAKRYLSLRKGNGEAATHLAIATRVAWSESLDGDRFITLGSGDETVLGLFVDDLSLLRTSIALTIASNMLLTQLLDTCHDDVRLDSHFDSMSFVTRTAGHPREEGPLSNLGAQPRAGAKNLSLHQAQERGPQNLSPDGDATNFLESILAKGEEVDVSRTAKAILLGLQDAAAKEVLLLALDVEREHSVDHVLQDV